MLTLLLALLSTARADEVGTCPDGEPADTGVVAADLSCASACDGCCAEDGTCLEGTADDACGVAVACQDCTASGDTCASGTCQSVAWTSFSYHDDDELDVRSIEDAARARTDALRFIYGMPSIPTDLPTTVEPNVDSPLPGLVGLDRVDRLTMDLSDGFTSVAYVFHPPVSNGKLMIFHQGHSQSYAADGGIETVGFFLQRGWDVAAMCMPLYGECTGPYASHGEMYNARFEGYSYLKFFLQPVAEVVNYGKDVLGASEIDMIGISGGGWTTTVAAALDPRIRVSIPVAGSLPVYLRSDPRDLGDAEQYGYEFYQIVGYPDLYVLGAIGPDRRQLQVLNRYDTCCFAGTLYQDYEADVASTVAAIAPGEFSVFLDPSHVSHEISNFALNAAIVHVADGDGVTIVDDIGPAYGAFQALGAWRDGSDDGSFGGHHQESSVEGSTATWTYTGEPGEYRVSTTWSKDSTLGSAVAYSVTGDRRIDVTVDQTAAPVGWADATARWQDLAVAIATASGEITVSVAVPAGATVRADAVRFERLCTACVWFADADGDGFGDANVTRMACNGEDGWVDSATDCDDSRSDVHPSAVEIPANSVDEDCDGGDATGPDDSGDERAGDSAEADHSAPPTVVRSEGCGCAGPSGNGQIASVVWALALAASRRRTRGEATSIRALARR